MRKLLKEAGIAILFGLAIMLGFVLSIVADAVLAHLWPNSIP